MGVCLAFGAFSAVVLPQAAVAQQKEKTVNPKVGAALQAALAAGKNKQWDVALAKVKDAEAEKKTAYEQFKINETLAYIYNGQQKYSSLAAIYEKQLEAPQFLTPEQTQSYPKIIAQIYFSAKEFPKAIEYSKRWLQDKPNDTDMLAMLGQAYYATKDNKLCKETLGTAIAAAEKAGNKPVENWLNTAQTCASNLGDDAAVTQAYEKLCRYYPKPEYWQPYLKKISRDKSSDLASFHWYQLMDEVGALKEAEDFTNYAQMAMIDYGMPGESVRTLEEGFSKHVLGADEKKKMRHQNTLAKAKEAAQANKAMWPQLATEAESDATGQKNVELAMGYFGAEQYDQAITQLEKAIKKGGAKEPAHVKMILGIAQLKKNQRDAARTTFKSIASDPVLGKVATAWTLRSYN
jgi:predicted Zn-dependent protease